MNINIKIKILITAALLTSFSGFASESTKDSKSLAPEAPDAKVEVLVAATTIAEAVSSLRSLSDIPALEKAFFTTAPTDREDSVLVGKLGVDRGNKAMILKLAEEIADNKHGAFDSLLIAHKGKLLFESYYKRGRINLPHNQASATKTYTGLVLGRAIQLGYLSLTDLEKPVASFLKDLEPSKFIDGAEKITLHQALTMSTGIRISDENREKMQKNPERLKGQGNVQGLFEHSDPITREAQVFRYGTGPELVMQVIGAVVPGTAQEFIKNEFLGKMDISAYLWLTAQSGLPESGWNVLITSRDMVKLGTLVMNKGRWHGEQLVPEAFINKATNRIVLDSDDENFSDDGSITNTGYGYFWWQADMKTGNKSYFSTSARGGGGQFIILVEELDLIIVATGAHRGSGGKNLQIAAERILPAFIK